MRLVASIAPHRPVHATLPADAGQMKKRVVVAVQKLPNDPVFGPRPVPPSWAAALALAQWTVEVAGQNNSMSAIRHAMAVAYGCCAKTAEEEVADLTGVELLSQRRKRGKKTRLVLLIGQQKPPLSPAGLALRWLSRRARAAPLPGG